MAELVLGANVFGWTADRDASFAVLDAFVDAGGTMIDTADSYTAHVPGNSGGESETILGEWMAARGNRDALHLATKVGSMPGLDGLSGPTIAAAVRESLRRLRTDRIDVYYAHRDDPDAAQEDTLDAFDALVRDGLVREIGASNFSAERLRSALEICERDGLAAFTVVQPLYNLLDRDDFEAALLPLIESAGLRCHPYYGLAAGFLTGKYRDGTGPGSPRSERALGYADSRGVAVLAGLTEIAAGYGVPVAAVALAWTAGRPGVTAPIASARTPAQLAELLPFRTLDLTHDELRLLTYLSATT